MGEVSPRFIMEMFLACKTSDRDCFDVMADLRAWPADCDTMSPQAPRETCQRSRLYLLIRRHQSSQHSALYQSLHFSSIVLWSALFLLYLSRKKIKLLRGPVEIPCSRIAQPQCSLLLLQGQLVTKDYPAYALAVIGLLVAASTMCIPLGALGTLIRKRLKRERVSTLA